MSNFPKKYGLLGKQLSHSFSQDFFTEKFKKEGIHAVYENIELESEEEVREWLQRADNDFFGVNVTLPYKSTVIPYLDELSDEAKSIGAVNTIHFIDRKKIGYNTDAFGFHQSIKPFFAGVHERALILGTGGAAKAIAYVLKNLGVDVAYLTRNPKDKKGTVFSYDEVNQHMIDAFKLIVNCTPVGMFPHENEMPNLPIHFVGEQHLVVDLIYNPLSTQFLKTAKKQGAITLNGLSMLKHQALKAWEIWQS